MTRRLWLGLFVVTLVACGGVWRPIGSTVASRGVERDVVRVPEWRDELRAIRLDVDNGAVSFRNVEVRYGSGRTHSIGRRINVRAGRAVVFNLPGGIRDVESVTLIYESLGVARAVVTVSGR
jgi:hypothetical protein